MRSSLVGAATPPSRRVSIAIATALVLTWGYVRLVVFDTTVFPLAYILPLLIGIWTRDRAVLWAMAAIFCVFHSLKIFWILPVESFSDFERWTMWGSTLVNIVVGAGAVHAIINLRGSLESALKDVRAQADELQAQGEELAQQNEELSAQAEELSQQTEELTQQGEELANQNEELQSQAEEIGSLNEALERREALLQTLLETARVSGSERAALEHIVAAARDLYAGFAATAVIYEAAEDGLRPCAPASVVTEDEGAVEDGFVALVLSQKRTASLDDATLRADLRLARLPGHPAFAAVLCAPIRLGEEYYGAFVIYAGEPREWTDEDFRLAEWLADQCARVLQTLRVQSVLREADRRKSEFLATLSHELRNPLTAIGFALNLMASGKDRDAKAIEVTRRQLRQLVRLVDDLLDATRMSSNKIQIRKAVGDLRQMVQEAADASRPDVQAARHELTLRLPDGPVWVDADADRISQLVTNLLSNATRYTPPGGRLTLEVEQRHREAVLRVIDTGVGIHPEDLERVFEMFTQVDGPGSGGLGIGLALVRGIAELHGGRVEASSDGPGQGSEFRVVLPLAETPRDTARTIAGGEPDRANGGSRVLIVDDNVDAVEMMAVLLEMHGHHVHVAHNAESALTAAREFVPDAAVLDIGLPGIDGYELARRLRGDERTRGIRLVALTGWGAESDRQRSRLAGFDAHLTKPADPDLILASLRDTEPA